MNIVKGMIYMARRFKAATALNVIGLIVAFAAFYLLATQVDYMQSYNRGIANYERIYRVEGKMNVNSKWGINVSRPILETLKLMPQVEGLTLMSSGAWDIELRVGETTLKARATSATHTPFGAMRPRCIDGELEFKDGMKNTDLIIPASLAQKLFGMENVAGRYVFANKDSLRIRGVYEDFPVNSSMANLAYTDMGDEHLNDFGEWSFTGYILLHEGADSEDMFKRFSENMRKALYKRMMGLAGDNGYDLSTEENKKEFDSQFKEAFGDLTYRLRPLSETYFSGVGYLDKGNPAVFLVLRLACVLIILIALINFLNFILAESPMRIKGVNTRRVLGESVTSLRLGLVGESVLLSLMACLFAFGIVYVASQEPTELLQGSLALGDHWGLVVLTLGLAIVIGVVAGIYPAWFATSFAPALALKGSFGLTPKGKRLRTVLVGLQLFISLLLTCYIGILYLQSHYIYNSDYGYDKNELLFAYLPNELKEKKDALRTELMQLPGIEDVSYSRFVLGSSDGYMSWGRVDDEGHVVTFYCLPVDWHYMNTLGIKIIEGRAFNEHDGDVMILNEAARKQWDWVQIDKPYIKDSEPVVGICENIRFGSTRIDRTAEPLAFIIFGENYKEWGDQLGVVNIRVGKNIDKVEARQRINDLLQKMGSSAEVEAKFLDQQLENLYQDEFRFIRQVLWFAAVCLIITLIGVFCLTMFETEYRRKEIGIRKVMGSSTQEILLMFCRHYALLLLVSFVVAAPVAYYVGSQWLQGFAERTPIYWWLFPLALLIVGTITIYPFYVSKI